MMTEPLDISVSGLWTYVMPSLSRGAATFRPPFPQYRSQKAHILTRIVKGGSSSESE